MHSLALFCGSSPGNDETIITAVQQLGEILANNHIRIVYGGANVGIMGALADSCLKAGGQVIGVMPEFLKAKEIAHPNLTELHVVQSMHERKALITELSDGFIALPGGIGTLDELFEIFTWQQLHLHNHPIGILNVNHFYDKLLDFLKHVCNNGFMKPIFLEHLVISENPHQLIMKLLANPNVPTDSKWQTLDKI